MYKTLDVTKISATIERLERRIAERFPQSGLRKVAHELKTISDQSAERTTSISKPLIVLRLAIGVILLAAIGSFLAALSQINVPEKALSLAEWVPVTEAALNTIVLMGAAIFFLLSFENRIKRRRALQSLHQLQSIAHVIDMHQLTKDPAIITQESNTPASPMRDMTSFELNRYLDYCSELLSLTGKLAAVFGQSINDHEVIAASNAIELLTTNLARKIWQKISYLVSHG